jgi:large subunit ribosomal protein L22
MSTEKVTGLPSSAQALSSKSQAKWVRMSARKSRLVLDNIRGRTVPEARTVLAFTSRAAAIDIERVLRSAVANAEATHGLDGDDLVVLAAYADEGPTLKRWRARARGRVNRIRKRTCHITVVVGPSPRQSSGKGKNVAAAATAEPGATTAESSAKRKSSRTRAKKQEGAAA